MIAGSVSAFDLEPDPRALARRRPPWRPRGSRRRGRVPQRERRDEQLAELLRPSEAGQVVEEVGDVGGDLLVGREEADVLVEPRRDRVVVAGADVDVAAKPVALAADDERRLRVDLQVREAVDDVDAGLLERARPLDVPPLVEARLQLDEADALLAGLGALDQRRDERRLVARAVDGRLQRDARRGSLAAARMNARSSSRTTRTGGGRRRRARRISAKSRSAVVDRASRGLRDRPPRLVLQLGAVELGELHQRRRGRACRGSRRSRRRPTPRPARSRSSIAADIDDATSSAHDVAEAAPAELGLDRLEQVVGVVRELDVGVARDAEDGALERSPCPGRARRGSARSRPRAAAAGRARRPRRSAAAARAPSRARSAPRRSSGSRASTPRLSESARDVRERLAGPDAERRQHREDLALEAAVELRAARPVEQSSTCPISMPSRGERGRAALAPEPRLRRRQLHRRARGSRRAPRAASARRPSGPRSPTRPGPIRPATRTMKNSSRLDEKIEQNLTRSSSGTARPRRARARAR